jgi:hypothetical protein
MTTHAPRGLGTAGKKLWKDVQSTHELRADELRVLEDAGREADIIDMMEVARLADNFELFVKGSQGQPTINPVISELRQHRATLASLLRQLKLTETAVEDAEERSTKARKAANARWGNTG